MPLLYGEGGIKAFRRMQEEFIKVNVDQSFLAWLLYPKAGESSTSDGNLLAGHPNDFRECNGISLASDDVAPFSLNNKGLQISLPLLENRGVDARRSSKYFAILACHPDGQPDFRICIPLHALEKTVRTFAFLPSNKHRSVSNHRFGAAPLTDCWILRMPKPSTPMVLWLDELPVSLVPQKPKVFYLDTSASTWICLSKPEESELSPIRVPRQREKNSYAVLFQPRSPFSAMMSSEYENTQCLKVLIRLDVSSYSVKIGIQLFYVIRDGDLSDLNTLPSTPTDEIWSNSCSQIVSIPIRESETISASFSWKRIVNDDALCLRVDLAAPDKYRVRQVYASLNSAFELLFPTDLYVHLVYGTISIWGLSLTKQLDVHLICIAAQVLYLVFKNAELTKPMISHYWKLCYHIPLILGVLLSSQVYLDDCKDMASNRYGLATMFGMACALTVYLARDIAQVTGYVPKGWFRSIEEDDEQGKISVLRIRKDQ